jgi:hypothetical protein
MSFESTHDLSMRIVTSRYLHATRELLQLHPPLVGTGTSCVYALACRAGSRCRWNNRIRESWPGATNGRVDGRLKATHVSSQ